jgi:hypothetical protein
MIIYWWDLRPSRILHSITGCLLRNVVILRSNLVLKGPFTIKDEASYTTLKQWAMNTQWQSAISRKNWVLSCTALKTWKLTKYFFLIITGGSACSSKPEQMISGPILDYVCYVKTNKIQGSYGQLLWSRSLMHDTKILFVTTLHSTPAI